MGRAPEAAGGASEPRERAGEAVTALEAGLLARVGRGDEAAMARLYDRLAPAVVGLACRITRDPRLAEDLAQEAFLRVWRQADRYRPERGSPRAWVLRIARNLAIDRLRSEGTRRRAASESGSEPRPEPVPPDVEVSLSESGRRLRAALEDLPQPQRRMIEIAYFEGLSHSEIASRESIPVGTVKTRIRDGVLRLRKAAEEGRLHA